ncbi:DUF2147 domain-containing protein [Trinickia caryophylli]|uniref:Uncharacterized conserved protein, DUF2147 family n=1 Tax=Trinickia caryophylli TaxID=28094 RepID=A0A1X7G986_TRICW|nr:DUF2147 domain-containing protein [Trinickia caryophylli]PMS11391.1 DUF2147 domain-containing protein [Trinickia caryophylli]TRX17586.1 DUF2147 domain-containing protein [Trinickia caryophylli]WQE11661.1 DUF2147 domain-containing protein [Trinickia caryophylli]SMF66228.1 Uncharacterized conserved protein, DUF2147 family [Trinickia caryophylli]GLU34846.1 hypothetical protein Busp01_46880 [Trinickia caryophylli]
MTHISHRAWAIARTTATRLVVAGLLTASATLAAAQGNETPVGVWQTIDDHTHQPKALVQITQGADGTLSGKVIKGLNPADSPDRRCTECSDERKDQKILGMTIIREMKPSGDHWDGGNILDPENGKVYKCKMTLEDGGQKLVVRGYIGVSLLGRSQTWLRQSNASSAQAQN